MEEARYSIALPKLDPREVIEFASEPTLLAASQWLRKQTSSCALTIWLKHFGGVAALRHL
jgi:hypothetical protein